MKTADVRFDIVGPCASFVLQLRGEPFRCFLDASDVSLLRERCSTIILHQPNERVRYVRVMAGGRQTTLHRFLLGLPIGDPRLGDHKNTNTLDYRRENLRIIDVGGNSLNHRSVRSDSRIGIRCVKRGSANRWCAVVRHEHLGTFADIRNAAEAVWLRLLQLDPISAANFIRSLPQ
jgi:hypothetical protein